MNSLTQFNRNHGEVISSTARSKVNQLLPRIVWLVLLLVVLFGSNSQSQSISADFSNRNGSTPAVPTNLFGANGTGVGVTAPGPVSQLTNAGLVETVSGSMWVKFMQISPAELQQRGWPAEQHQRPGSTSARCDARHSFVAWIERLFRAFERPAMGSDGGGRRRAHRPEVFRARSGLRDLESARFQRVPLRVSLAGAE